MTLPRARAALPRAVSLLAVLLTAVAGCAGTGPGSSAGGPGGPGTAGPAAHAGQPAEAPGSPSASGGRGAAAQHSNASAQPGADPGGSPSATPARPLAGQVVVLDPGHNGGNAAHPGIIDRLVNVITEWKPCDTVGTETDAGYPEHAFNFDVAVRLARLLRADGATVILTRGNDHGVGPCITERAAIGNRAHAAAALSIHADGGPPGGTGFQIIEPGLVPGHNDAIIAPSARLGLAIRNAYHRLTGEPYSDYAATQGIDVRTDLGGLNLSAVPKVFIECGNMRNAADAARLTSPRFRQRIAAALTAGLIAFLDPGAGGDP